MLVLVKNPIAKPFILLVSAILLLSISPDPADADDLKWSRFNLPSNGVAGKWVLAEGSDIRYPTLASDGTIYCYASPAGTPFRLFKSTDGGYTWTYTGRVEEFAGEPIVGIAVIPDNPNFVYYATTSKVYKSSDAGNTFNPLAGNPGQAGTGSIKITSLDVISANGINYIIVGTCDSDSSQYGGVYLLAEGQPSGWGNTLLGNYDACTVIFSPNYAVDGQIIAVATNEIDTILTTNLNNTGWGTNVEDARLPGLVAKSAAIAFPSDYDSDVISGKYNQFFALNTGTGNGDVYSLKVSSGSSVPIVADLGAGMAYGLNNLDITSLAVSGNADSANIVSGASLTAKVYTSTDGGHQWSSGNRPPSGSMGTYVFMSANFASSGITYATTSGPESAFSISSDKGLTWNQTGLIDTRISSIQDVAISPNYSLDKTLFLLTSNVQNSLWYTSSAGEKWQRVYYSLASSGERMNLVLLSHQFAQNKKVFMAGMTFGTPVIWKSEDSGQHFVQTNSVDPRTGDPVEINSWAMGPGDMLFVGSFDGSDGIVYQTSANGLPYIDLGKAGKQIINTVALSPDYASDHTILVGNTFGSVFYSTDSGLVFQPLPLDAINPPFTGSITVAFDPNYSQNKAVYAASNNLNGGIYRFIIGQNRSWEPIDTSLSLGAKIGKLVTSESGMLYGVNMQTVDITYNRGGIERSLEASTATNPSFETVTSGLDDGSAINKLWAQGSSLWTVEVNLSNSMLYTYSDTLTSPVTLSTPSNNITGLSANVTISWASSVGATAYNWQVDTDTQFSYIPNGFEGETDVTSIRLPSLAPNITYYWRVRASQPVSSPWSSVWSFNTQEIATPKLSEPRSSSLAPINPIFKWTASEGAEKYELMVSRNDTFTDLAIHKSGNNACNSNVWISDVSLTYNTSYYWRVRAICGSYLSPWSEASIFTTEPAPSPTPSPTPTSPILATPKLTEPKSNTPCAVLPIFKWGAVDGAQKYELQVSPDDAFLNLVINRDCNANVWQSDVTLAYNTGYYWRVRAVAGENKSSWSDVGIFITASAPAPSPPPVNYRPPIPNPSPTPSASVQPTITPIGTKPASSPSGSVSPTNLASVVKTPVVSATPSPSMSTSTSKPQSTSESSTIPKVSPRNQSSPDSHVDSGYQTKTPPVSTEATTPLNWTWIILIGSVGIIIGGVAVSIFVSRKNPKK